MKKALTAALVALSVSCFAQDVKSSISQAQTTEKSAENKALTQQFEQAKGKMQMPVTGIIKEHMGVELSTNKANPGISIGTVANADVHAVFEGTVSSVFTIDGSSVVIIQHGKYFTVYANMASATVAKGEHISKSQTLGMATKGSDPMVEFQVWQANGMTSEKLNPEEWLNKA